MKKVGLIVSAMVWAITSPSLACTIMLDSPRPGETLEQTVFRQDREAQVASWNQADSVFLARVAKTTKVANGGVRYTFSAIAPVHGAAPPRRLSGIWYGDGCHGREWTMGEVAVVYANRIGLREDWSHWGQWHEVVAVPPSAIRDPRVAPALRASAHRLKVSRQ